MLVSDDWDWLCAAVNAKTKNHNAIASFNVFKANLVENDYIDLDTLKERQVVSKRVLS